MTMYSSRRFLAELIALPSVNPAFASAGDPAAGEHRVGEFLLASAAKAGLDVETQEVAPGRLNYLAHLNPRSRPRRRILLAPHLDTVPATPGQLRPVVKGDRLYGRGACDTKGSVASMFLALCDLAATRRLPADLQITFAGLADEEHAQLGSRGYVRSGRRADLAIVGEPTRLAVITAHKGNLWLRLETRGKAAHGARPQLGENAVHKMCLVVDWLETTHMQVLQQRQHPLLGSPTVNVGVIRGGTQANIVPDRCEIVVDRRTIPGETQTSVIRELKSALRQAGLSAAISNGKDAPCLPMETDTSHPLVAAFLSSMKLQPKGAHYFCDAAIFSAGGIPSIVYGPGDISQAHTVDEWISLKSVETARRKLVRFFQSLA